MLLVMIIHGPTTRAPLMKYSVSPKHFVEVPGRHAERFGARHDLLGFVEAAKVPVGEGEIAIRHDLVWVHALGL